MPVTWTPQVRRAIQRLPEKVALPHRRRGSTGLVVAGRFDQSRLDDAAAPAATKHESLCPPMAHMVNEWTGMSPAS